METPDRLRQRVQRERTLKTRLQLATLRLADAEHERLWAIVAAHEAGWSLRQIAAATGLSRSRIHQLLHHEDAREIPVWRTPLGARDLSAEVQTETDRPSPDATMQARVAAEVAVLRWCIDWRERLARGERGVVNLRPDTADAQACVPLDPVRVLRVLARIASDVDAFAHAPADVQTDHPIDRREPRTRHRRRLAVPEESPRGRTATAPRDAIRTAAGLPPDTGDDADDRRGTD